MTGFDEGHREAGRIRRQAEVFGSINEGVVNNIGGPKAQAKSLTQLQALRA